jgi:hypothetical protein
VDRSCEKLRNISYIESRRRRRILYIKYKEGMLIGLVTSFVGTSTTYFNTLLDERREGMTRKKT